jgi:acyl-CoA reductase-like NAD-dependent aldehyde dehydrogenase
MSNYIYKQLIDGEWVEAAGAGTWDLLNPADESLIRPLPFGDERDAEAAIYAAARAFPKWSAKTPYQRADILKKAADLMRERIGALAVTSTRESGKPLAEARGEWTVAADLFEWFAEEGKRAYGRVIPSRQLPKRRLVLKQPLGVVGVITAWNFPSYNPARATAAALAAGCTVVLRPSEYTPMTAMEMAHILVEAGLPSGVLNLINGDAHAMGQALLNHPSVRKISFTGSTRVGRILMEGAGRTFTRLGLELGGNAPALIFPDVDVKAVAKSAVAAKFRNNGQVCVSPQRFLVHSRIAEDFIEQARTVIQALKVGDGMDSATEVGPLINAKQRERLEALVESVRGSAAQVLVGGARPPDLPKGYFYSPTLIANVPTDSPLFREEIFGPVMPITVFEDADHALSLANDTEYGLAAYVFTNDFKTAIRMYEGLEFGMVGVNEWYPQTTEAPFAGWKQSGMGVEAGAEGLDDYLEVKTVALGLA